MLARIAVQVPFRQPRPSLRLGYPKGPVSGFAVCELPAKRSSRIKLQLTDHGTPCLRVDFPDQSYGGLRSRAYCPNGHCPKGQVVDQPGPDFPL